jgi:inner membrane protein
LVWNYVEGKSHAAIGAAAGLAAGVFIDASLSNKLVMLGVGTLGGLWPDLDTHASYLGQKLPRWWHKLTPGHRGITHSLIYCVGLFFVALLAQLGVVLLVRRLGHDYSNPSMPLFPIALTAGALSHLIADAMTTQGTPFLYPLIKHKFRLFGPLNFPTGSPPERVMVMIILALTSGYVIYPLVAPASSGLVHTPRVLGLPTEPVLIVLAIATLVGIMMTIWSLVKHHKRKKARRRARARIRARAHA